VRPCLIDGILPTNAVHLLGGSPGAGKTRFTFGLINDWQTGNKFLGHNCSPVPYCFISLDRPRASVEETLETMDLKGQITRLLCLDEVPDDPTLAVTMTAAVKKYPDSQMFFTA
jgi:RecA-family ATPase